MIDWNEKDKHKIANNMIKYGGDFVRHLGYLIKKSDLTNFRKLARTFAVYFTEYYEWDNKN